MNREGGASELQAELSEILEKQRALQTELSRTKADNFILEDEIVRIFHFDHDYILRFVSCFHNEV